MDWLEWAFIVIIVIAVGFYLKRRADTHESFVANNQQHNIYLNNDDVIPRTNDIRDQIQDFHDQYNDTHSWLWTELLHGNPKIKCTHGYIPDNKWAGPGLAREPAGFYNRRNPRSRPFVRKRLQPGEPEQPERDDAEASPAEPAPPRVPFPKLDQRERPTRFDASDLPLYHPILDIKSTSDVPHRVFKRRQIMEDMRQLRHDLKSNRQRRRRRNRDQTGGSPYNHNLLFEPAPSYEHQQSKRGVEVVYHTLGQPATRLPAKTIRDIRMVQPHFLDKVEITQRGDQSYYHDARYPQELVPVEFIQNHRKYTLDNLGRYPCYRYISKF